MPLMDDSPLSSCCPDLEQFLDPELFKALADHRRLTLLLRLCGSREALTVGELSECCGVHLSGVSRHLAQLHRAGAIAVERRGREVLYRPNIKNLVSTLRGLADALSQYPSEDCLSTRSST